MVTARRNEAEQSHSTLKASKFGHAVGSTTLLFPAQLPHHASSPFCRTHHTTPSLVSISAPCSSSHPGRPRSSRLPNTGLRARSGSAESFLPFSQPCTALHASHIVIPNAPLVSLRSIAPSKDRPFTVYFFRLVFAFPMRDRHGQWPMARTLSVLQNIR